VDGREEDGRRREREKGSVSGFNICLWCKGGISHAIKQQKSPCECDEITKVHIFTTRYIGPNGFDDFFNQGPICASL